MKLYLIGGLGADERVFKYLTLDVETTVIKWIEPKPKEKLQSYVIRISEQINQGVEFGILGVSFGGIVPIELSKITNPSKLFLISSVETSKQLPQNYVYIGKTQVLNLIPNQFIKPPKPLLGFLFGAKNKKLLEQIIKDTKPKFIRWALNAIINWSNELNYLDTIRIHGTKDKLIPLKGNAIEVKDGGHFMIVDNAEEISKIINEQLKNAG